MTGAPVLVPVWDSILISDSLVCYYEKEYIQYNKVHIGVASLIGGIVRHVAR